MILASLSRWAGAAMLVAVLLPNIVQATTKRSPTINELYENADLVASIYVLASDVHVEMNKSCGTKYVGAITHVFKRPTKWQPRLENFSFGRSEDLKIGYSYLLFLRRVDDAQSEYDKIVSQTPSLRTRFPKSDAVKLIACGGIVPGFVFDADAAWRITRSDVSVIALWPKDSIPRSIIVEEGDGPEWVLESHSLFSFLDKLNNQHAK